MFDAIATGCVPVLLSNDWLPTLPFKHFIDYEKFTIFLDHKANLQTLSTRLKLIASQNKDQRLRRNGLDSFPALFWGSRLQDSSPTSPMFLGQAPDYTLAEAYRVWHNAHPDVNQ